MTVVVKMQRQKPSKLGIVKSVAKFFLTPSLRSALHTLHRAVVFRRAFKKFLWGLEHRADFDQRVLRDLIYGWGNEAWSSDTEYLQGCLEHAQACRGPILECGSGLTTLLIGALVQKSGNVLCSLEHHVAWGQRVSQLLKRYRIHAVQMHVRPLKEYGDFIWYQPPAESTPDNYALVVCDGPPGATYGGRYGLLPVMKSRLAPDCVILLDDADRPQEQAIAKRWAQELDTHYETLGTVNPYIRFKLRDDQYSMQKNFAIKRSDATHGVALPEL